ncbi:MAG: L,D-transpeptidase family protein [Vicinamibacteria bacterium]
MLDTKFGNGGIATAPGIALLLVGSALTLLALLGLAALIGLVGLLDAPGIGGSEGGQDLSLPALPAPPRATPRDPWTPLSAGLRHLARTRPGSSAKVLGRMYEEKSFRPFWVTPDSLSDGGESLLLHLAGPGREAWRSDEHRLTEIGHLHHLAFPEPLEADAHAIAELEWVLSESFMRYATGLLEGRAPWARAWEDWHLAERSPSIKRIVGKLDEWGAPRTLKFLLRSHERYTSLRKALLEYRSIERAGGWQSIEAGASLERGDRSKRVGELRRRLAVTGDLKAAGDAPVFDAELEPAVRKFQQRHGLNADGRVGSKTLEALNVPVEERIRQLEINLERCRWLPASLGEEFIWVNVPEFRLRAYRSEREVLSMPVVVGAPESPTPSFREEIDYAVLNPYWYVPESIAVNELMPKAHKDPGFLMRANYELLDEGGSLVASDKLRKDLLLSGHHRIRRKPGPRNDLGRIKFMLPNRFRIYLHDTPARHLFERTSRAFSHGCIRVGQPLDLAKYLFADRFRELESGLDTGEEKVLHLREPVPVYIVYFTAWRSDDGTVNFRNDIYGRDGELALQLSGATPSERPDLALQLLWPHFG